MNKLALITGTGSGVGKSVAKLLLNKGYKVVGYSRNNNINHPNFEFIQIDLSIIDNVRNISFPDNEGGNVVLINNAATIGEIIPFNKKKEENIISEYNLNIITPCILSHKFINTYQQQKLILNIGSGAATKSIPSWSTYCSTKVILLDEIGRGTSTYDGVSIAWAIAEYLHENTCKAKTLFATHYHELNDMTNTFERIKNFNVSVKEMGKRILFIRTLKEGGSEHSFGIHVAKMAGMPKKIIKKSEQILKKLEKSRTKEGEKDIINHKEDMQLSFFQLDDPTLIQIQEEIAGIDINTLTPVEALMKLNEIKKLIGK